MAETHTILGGKVHVYRRENSGLWQCSAYLAGKNYRVSTKTDSLSQAKDFAEDWYFGLRGKQKSGELKSEKTFKDGADQFTREYEVMTKGERNAKYVEDHQARLRNHLIPFFGKMGLSEIKTNTVQDYRIARLTVGAANNSAEPLPSESETRGENKAKPKKAPSRSTMHHEIVTLRQVLKTAVRHGWLERLPDLSMPYRSSSKVTHRAWFSPEEYRRLYEATRKHAREGKDRPWQWAAEQLHDYVLLLANTGIRPDEANVLQYRDASIIEDEATGETILEIEVRGKRGVGYCKSMPGAVRPFQRLVERNKPKPNDLLFPVNHKKQFNGILASLDLKLDRDGNRRTAYSLRHTYICMRLMEGADIYQIAKNCRTSVEMIENYYASHIRTNLDASAINVRRKKRVEAPAE